MIDISIINSIIKMLFTNFCTSYIFLRSSINTVQLKLQKWQYILLILNNIFISIIFATLNNVIDIVIAFIVSYGLYSICMKFIAQKKLSSSILITTISVAISIFFMGIAAIMNYFLLFFIPFYNEEISYIEYIIIGMFQSLQTYLLFKIKKFKYGFSFLIKPSHMNDINYIGSIIGILSLLLCILFGIVEDNKIRTYFTIGLILSAFILYQWIRYQMKKYYQNELIDDTINSLKAEIENLNSKLSVALKLNHNYSHRISALESEVKNLDSEFAAEISPDLIDAIHNLSQDFRNEQLGTINISKLPSTNVYAIDNILSYMSKESSKNDIEFNVQVNESLKYITTNIISEGQLITMLTNHINNSIIAINSGTSLRKAILVILGKVDDCYGFCIHDTGIQFDINTLLKLGTEKVTTHEEGTGTGFMTTFETINQYNASLIIEENAPDISLYSKSITIKFDNKNEYKIISYRADEIKSLCQNNKIQIEGK